MRVLFAAQRNAPRRMLLSLGLVILLGTPAGAQVHVPRSVFGGGPTHAASGTYKLRGTVAQPTIGRSAGSAHYAGFGYWLAVSRQPGLAAVETEAAGERTLFWLGQNRPNPFNPSTVIPFAVPTAGDVVLKVYNVQGREVATLLDEHMGRGFHAVEFRSEDLASGIYFYRLQTQDRQKSKRMLLVK